MINEREMGERQTAVRKAAARRWHAHAQEVARTAAQVAKLGAVAAASLERRSQYLEREFRKAPYRATGFAFERMIGPALDFDDMAPTPAAFEAGKPVARVVELVDTTRIGDGFATGFMLSGGLLMTNWHVFRLAGDAVGCGAQFGFQRIGNGLIEGGVVFELDPADFFYSDEQLDIALIAVRPRPVIGSAPLADFRFIRLIPSTGKILAGQPISIVQHPDGGHKRWAVRENKLVREPTGTDLFLEYTTDTLPGSSGSPAFNKDWELVAVHHSGVPRMRGEDILLKDGQVWQPGVADSEIDWVANEGVRVSKLHDHLLVLAARDPNAHAKLAPVLATSTDPAMTGETRTEPLTFGSLPEGGRSTQVVNSVAPACGPAQEPGLVSVVVNGTAHFHFARAAQADVAAGTASAVVPRTAWSTGASALAVEKKLRFDPKYATRPGYSPHFLDGFVVPHPLGPTAEVVRSGAGQKVLNYHHFSLVMHEIRRLCMWAASNVNYDKSKRWRDRKDFGTDTWKLDPRILGEQQIDDAELYEPAKKFDRGHIVRRDDVAWGDTQEQEEFGNSDSFHFTNCTPQHEQFNRAMFDFHGLWGELENHIAKQAGFLQNKLCVFAGPVLSEGDPKNDFGLGSAFQVPVRFWKVIVAVEDVLAQQRLRAYGFLLSQQEAIDRWGWEGRFRAGKFKEQQLPLARLTQETRVTFAQVVLDADPLARDTKESSERTLRSLSDVRLR